jgi:hypothetical protein
MPDFDAKRVTLAELIDTLLKDSRCESAGRLRTSGPRSRRHRLTSHAACREPVTTMTALVGNRQAPSDTNWCR